MLEYDRPENCSKWFIGEIEETSLPQVPNILRCLARDADHDF